MIPPRKAPSLKPAVGLVGDERHDREAQRDVVVGRRRVQQRDLADERHHPEPVAQQDEEEERPDKRDVLRGGRAAGVDHEVDEGLYGNFERTLEATRYQRELPRAEIGREDQDGHDDPHRHE